MRTSLFCHIDDISAALDMADLRKRGLSRLAANVLYHDWVCWAPLSRFAPLRRGLGGTSAVPVGAKHPTRLRPAYREGSQTLVNASDAGLELDAWTVSLHRDDLARVISLGEESNIDASATRLAIVDVFGTQSTTWICPSSDEAAAYLSAHVSDIASTGTFERVIVEGCHYPMLQHGGAHERDLSRLGSSLTRMLELCFCPACMARFAADGHDPEQWRTDVAAAVLDDPLRLDDDPRMREATDQRRRRVIELFGAMSKSAPDLDFVCADQPAIAATFRTGVRTGGGKSDAAVGFDLPALASWGTKVLCLAYFRSVSEVANHVAEYLDKGIAPAMLEVALRPGLPDCSSLADLTEKLCVVSALGISNVAFYELTQLDRDEWQRTLGAFEAAAAL